MNLSLKHKLMLQSLSPLAFLTIVRNFKFTPVSELAENQSYWGEFVRLNNVLIVVFLLCATWILAAIISFISFTAILQPPFLLSFLRQALRHTSLVSQHPFPYQ